MTDQIDQGSPSPKDLRTATIRMPASVTDATKLELFREIIQQASSYIDSQARFAMSADNRAVYIATAFAAFSSVLLAAALAAFASSQSCSGAYFWSLFVASAITFFAVGRALWSTKPDVFYTAGVPPAAWQDDLAKKPQLLDHLIDMADLFQERIQKNEATLQRNAEILKQAIIAGCLAPIVGTLVFFWQAYAVDATCKVLADMTITNPSQPGE
jgi:hypothetical protein